jgi:hypothetical protein
MTIVAWTRRQDSDEQLSATDSECAWSDDERVGWASSRCGSSGVCPDVAMSEVE